MVSSKFKWVLYVIAALALSFSVLAGCAGDDDDDDDNDDNNDDDDLSWQGEPEINISGDDALEELSADVLEAIALAPGWLEHDLIEAFHNLNGEYPDLYAGLLLNVTDDRFIDEIAFCIAHMFPRDLSRIDPQLLVDNVASAYAADEQLSYVTIVDEGSPAKGTDYYSTLEIQLADGAVTLEKEIYYWYVIHPRLEDERPSYIDPETGGQADPPDGVFWRDYLLNNADDDCPGKVECPVLADMLAEEDLLWAGLNDAPDNGAVGAITRWVNVSMVFDSGTSRPIQPVAIYRIHMGRCGEHADLTSAAARAALVPTTNTAAYADDHTWNEFYDGAWHEWEPVNGMIDEFDHYDNWGGGGEGLHAVYNSRGDGFIWNRTPDYTPTCIVNVTVEDEDGHPVEGARVTNAGMVYGRYMTNYQGFTDTDGTLTFELGDQKQIAYMQVKSPLGDYPEGDPERVITGSLEGKVYDWEVTLPGVRQFLDISEAAEEEGTGRYEIRVDYDFPNRYLHATSVLGSLEMVEGSMEGSVQVMILDAENFARYNDGETFAPHTNVQGAAGTITLDLPRPGTWYVVVTNEEALSSVQLGQATVTISQSGEEVATESHLMRLEPGDRFLFGMTGF